ncbi:site-specific integrase [Ralstonia pseudosolanacearum]|uniref:site-specific integrase n=1 Tax=Ralstonia pseudosolanacearum TaxID=1310165 RepID=UPI002230064E|nr:site-specific integrase [Ralstonia sp. RS650]UZF29106.1 site-specific integrase [Ralstonia sp. RS650]
MNRFERHLGQCKCVGFTGMHSDKLLRGIRAFVAVQQGRPLCTAGGHQVEEAPAELWDSFCRWMREQRGISERTLRDYRQYLHPLLAEVGVEPGKLNSTRLQRFVLELGRNCGNARVKATASALRTFIRFLVADGQCPANLVNAIPSVAYWRLSSLPQYLQPEEVERVLVSVDTQTPVGKRDRAILLLLARLGLRAGDVVQLRLADIDWRSAAIRVCGKNRQQTHLPLTQEVGDAIVSYLQHGREPTNSDRLFVRAIAPFRPFRDARGISDIAKLALRRAGVNAPQRGAAHVLRHSAATAMLRQGASLQDIAIVLRHQSVASTQIYAKVDVVALHELAQPWPQVLPC